MDLYEAIRSLQKERKRLDRAIERLERQVQNSGPARNRHARKTMSAAKRAELSERMKLYWARRRQTAEQAQHSGGSAPDAAVTPAAR